MNAIPWSLFLVLLGNMSVSAHPIQFNENSGVFTVSDFEQTPTEEGVLASYPITLPAYVGGHFFSGMRPWPSNANRLFPWCFKDNLGELFGDKGLRIPSVGSPERRGSMIIIKQRSGEFLSIVPVTTKEITACLYVDTPGNLTTELVTLGTESVRGTIPVISWYRSNDLYEACYKSWDLAFNIPGAKGLGRKRSDKQYPEMFNYLGWCSWEEFKLGINEAVLKKAYDDIEASDVPVRWFLVDNGHQDETFKEEDNQPGHHRQLVSFDTHRERFPNGWDFLNQMKGKGKIKWTGLWHGFNGHWGLIATNHNLPELDFIEHNDHLLVKNDSVSANKFYDKMIGTVKKSGFDFVKIDIQANCLEEYRGLSNPVKANFWMSQALEESCVKYELGLMNCMCMNNVCLFNTPYSSSSRVSVDYVKGNLKRAKSHLHQSYSSTLWLGYTAFPDHDMFHSSDHVRAQMMAVSKAMSCAPIYLSDNPEEFVPENIAPLCYQDGELIKPLAPAVPLSRSALVEIYAEPNPYTVIAPLPNNSAAMVCYNLTSPEQKVIDAITAEDFREASAMIQPYPGKWAIPEEGLVIYDWYKRTGEKLDSKYAIVLEKFSDRLLIACPIVKGWSVIGRPDKYLPPATVSDIKYGSNILSLTMKESGPFVFWSDSEPKGDGDRIISLCEHLWLYKAETGKKDVVITLRK